jgi:hypothetical protein
MKLIQYKLIFIAIGLIGSLLIASPVLADILNLPIGERFSEIYLLGPNQMASDLPFNIIAGHNYSVYIGIGNHMDSTTSYVCYVKLRNQTEPAPDSYGQKPSSLSPVYEYRTIIQNGANWTTPLTFSFPKVLISNNQSFIQSVNINNVPLNVTKYAAFDQKNEGYYYQLIIELWAYNPTLLTLQYSNRYVYFWLNATSTA